MNWPKENWFKISLLITVFLLTPLVKVNAGYFVVENVGDDMIVVNDGYSQYVVEYNYECYSSNFFKGDTIYIDSSFTPLYGDTIVTSGYFEKTCEVTDAEKVDLERYFVDKVLDSDDNIIVTDKLGDSYLVEYGLGCGLSFWRYEGKYIDIDIGGSFLDGISDQIYLFDSGDDCKVWDAEELSGNYSGGSSANYYGTYTPPPQTSSCPANSYESGDQCLCIDGYVVNNTKNACITINSQCQGNYGLNSYGSGKSCYCAQGYQWNTNQTSCVVVTTPTPTILPPTFTPITFVNTAPESFKIDNLKIKVYDDTKEAVLKVAGNFRECPSTTCSIKRNYAETAKVKVLGDYDGGEWYKVEARDDYGNSIEGWMHNSVLEIIEQQDNQNTDEIEIIEDDTSISDTSKKPWFVRFWKFIFGE